MSRQFIIRDILDMLYMPTYTCRNLLDAELRPAAMVPMNSMV